VAYRPDLVPLHAADGTPRLPQDLIPLCRLRYSSQVCPEAVEAVRALTRMDVEVKVFSSRGARAAEQASAVLEQAGQGTASDVPLGTISGPELVALVSGPSTRGHGAREQWAHAVAENAILAG
jgi:hypothetical protein